MGRSPPLPSEQPPPSKFQTGTHQPPVEINPLEPPPEALALLIHALPLLHLELKPPGFFPEFLPLQLGLEQQQLQPRLLVLRLQPVIPLLLAQLALAAAAAALAPPCCPGYPGCWRCSCRSPASLAHPPWACCLLPPPLRGHVLAQQRRLLSLPCKQVNAQDLRTKVLPSQPS